MNMNGYLFIILLLLIGHYLLDLVLEWLNIKHIKPKIPASFEGWYDGEQYARSQKYLLETSRFDVISSTIMLPVTLLFILLGGFGFVDAMARSAGLNMIGTGLLFTGGLVLLSQLVHIPLSIYSTFVLEEKYGFNKTTAGTFALDQLKSILLIVVIGAPVLSLVLWFFSAAGQWGWLYCWIALSLIQLFLMIIAPVTILPLFNKFTPMAEGELKSAIQRYADKAGVSLKGVFTIDGSRRSTKSNAYFTGLGRWKRIALFDTLIEKHSIPELVSILAHEVGHYKLGHIKWMMLISIFSNGIMLFILSLFLYRKGLYEAFSVSFETVGGHLPIYAGLVFFGFLYTPINLILSIVGNWLSRKHEYEADAFAVETAENPDAMIDALKKLSVDNLSNLTPHPAMVFMTYSHPPVLERIKAICDRKEDRHPKSGS